jgi:hypothetical protein
LNKSFGSREDFNVFEVLEAFIAKDWMPERAKKIFNKTTLNIESD